MFNNAPYNTNTLNHGQPTNISLITDEIIFNGFWLQNANIISSFKNDDNLPDISLNTSENPIIDGGVVLNRKYPQQNIVVEGKLNANSAEELLELMDNFKFFTSKVEGYLDIKKEDWNYRRVKATCVKSELFDKKHYNIDHVPFKIEFKTVEPFFYLREMKYLNEFILTSNITYDIPYLGTAPSFPIMYLLFTTASATNEIEIIKWNDTITINETINAGDIVVINWETKTVQINGIDVDYDWTFFDITKGANIMDINVNWTFSYDLTILYNQKYL